MLFNSFSFLFFFLIVLCLYYLPFLRRYQVYILVLASLYFYGYHTPGLLVLLLSSVTINTLASYYVRHGAEAHKKLVVTCAVIINLLILSVFKYGALVVESVTAQATSVSTFLMSIPLPIGISFFTFEGIRLMIDVYKGRHSDRAHIVTKTLPDHTTNTLLFVSFFPHLIAGPILKAQDFYPQIGVKRVKEIDWDLVFKSVTTGFFLKMVVADNLNELTNQIAYPYFTGLSSVTLITLLFGYSFQIFADFAGYSLIAIGIAAALGYRFNPNFNFPYTASSFKDFWKRWHISLSTFLMEYLYIPLGGNRKGKLRTYFNLLLTMFLGGLWHGAAWSYAVWGLTHGLFLSLERYLNEHFSFSRGRFPKALSTVLVFSVVTFAWLFFKLPDFQQVIFYVESIFNNSEIPTNINIIFNVILVSTPVILYHAFNVIKTSEKLSFHLEYIVFGIMLFLILTNSGTAGEFIYFQF